MTSLMEPQEPIVAVDEPISDARVLQAPAEAAVETVAQAFENDPGIVFCAVAGRGRDYARALLQWLRTEHTYQIHEMGGQFQCAAFVLDTADTEACPPEQPLPKLDPEAIVAAVQQGSADALVQLGLPRPLAELTLLSRPDRLGLAKLIHDELSARMQQYIKEHGPVLHLRFLGCREQSQGLGSKMLADAQGKWVYLETLSDRTAGLYRRHGFQDVGQYQVGGQEGAEAGAPLFYIMARPPGANESGAVGPEA